MEKKQIFESIKQSFPQSIINPVNPFTVDNPDVLVFNGRSLKGLFFPMAKEINNPDLLLRRLFLSRLSLCKTISHVLVLHNDESMKLTNSIELINAFDGVFYEDWAGIVPFLKDDIRQRHSLNPQLRRVRMRRFWGTIDYIEKNGIIETKLYSKSDIHNTFNVRSWSNPDKEKYNKNTRYNYPILIASKDRTKQSFKEDFDNLMTLTTMFNYSLSDGVFKSNPEALETFLFLNVETVENVMKNPINIRTLAFIGYLPGRVSDNYNMEGLRDRYYAFMKNGKYW